MKINCPSCNRSHETADYKGAFDIPCPCGYNIIMPDEETLNKEKESVDFGAGFDSHMPVAGEVSLQGGSINKSQVEESSEPQSIVVKKIAVPELDIPILSGQMTAPDDLPEGMLYDPYELPGGEGEISVKQHIENESSRNNQFTGRQIIQRTQSSSMGQFLGINYSVRCEGLGETELKNISLNCQRLVKERRWLESELLSRGINISEPSSYVNMENVPEILAVEIYIYCVQAGGTCYFQKMA